MICFRDMLCCPGGDCESKKGCYRYQSYDDYQKLGSELPINLPADEKDMECYVAPAGGAKQ